jgi:preprotein translocase subunit SecB
MSEQQGNQSPEQSGNQFALQRIYLKDTSFESPASPNGFRQPWQPKVNLDLNTRHENLEENMWEVVLGLTVTTKNEQDVVMYLVEVQQAGIFHIEGLESEAMAHTLGSFCPSVLFPYAREVVDSMVVKGSFPALMLSPVNFNAIYEQSRLAEAQEANKIQ